MQLPHNSFVLVADGKKSLFFRNQGDAEFPNLIVEGEQDHPDAKDGEIKSDGPGRTFASVGAGRSAYQETDFHQQAEDRFAAGTAGMLAAWARENETDQLVVVAPPRTLGELRKHYPRDFEKRLLAELAKDLVNTPVAEIEKILRDA
ncbi:host attachment family protein [Allosphingosinicella sp.]|uniref:host attachment family protein n=1 Tax=Allosphingosinicella sp. TaxID=2823234 RepID=UPI003784C300